MSHSVYSFSGSHRWMPCPASIRMSRGYPESTSEAAELGTATHELGEFCITLGIDPKLCAGLTFNGFVVDTAMIDAATLYKTVVDNLTLRYGERPLLERRVIMSSLGRNDVFGTSDCTFIVQSMRLVHTVDFKNGRVDVDVDDNSQLAGYSVATIDTFNLWDKVDRAINTIVQPNYAHIAGPVRHTEYDRNQLIDWQKRYAIAVHRADDPNEKPVAGEHCHYCPAQANCRARMEMTLKHAYTDCNIDEISIGELEAFYNEMNSVKKFLEKVAERMLKEARQGTDFKNYKLVNAIQRATVNDVQGLLNEVKALNIDPIKLFLEPRLVGKTRANELLPKSLVSKYYRMPPASTTLAPLTDNRPALRVGKASGIFTPLVSETKSANGIFTPL